MIKIAIKGEMHHKMNKTRSIRNIRKTSANRRVPPQHIIAKHVFVFSVAVMQSL